MFLNGETALAALFHASFIKIEVQLVTELLVHPEEKVGRKEWSCTCHTRFQGLWLLKQVVPLKRLKQKVTRPKSAWATQ